MILLLNPLMKNLEGFGFRTFVKGSLPTASVYPCLSHLFHLRCISLMDTPHFHGSPHSSSSSSDVIGTFGTIAQVSTDQATGFVLLLFGVKSCRVVFTWQLPQILVVFYEQISLDDR